MGLLFEWDARKAAENVRKHGISFEEARTTFADAHSLTVEDPDHSLSEARLVHIGLSAYGRLIVVAFTERNNRIRIINARIAARKEKQQYEKGF